MVLSHRMKACGWWPFLLCWEVVTTLTASPQLPYNGLDIFNFDVNGIFDASLVPIQVFSKEQLRTWFNAVNASSVKFKWADLPKIPAIVNSKPDFGTAFPVMLYHRQKINEFLAADFLANQILETGEDAQLAGENWFIEKRMGDALNDSMLNDGNFLTDINDKFAPSHKLLDDENMNRYKSWLERTTTLHDIHRQFEASKKRRSKYRRHTISVGSNPVEIGGQDFEDGDITGYAMADSSYEYPKQTVNYQQSAPALVTPASRAQLKMPFLQKINKNGYENGYDEYGIHSSAHSHPETHLPRTPTLTETKEIGLKDITDIALTSLAFLSFGMFILQVLMCITMGKEDSNNMMMLPMEATDPSEIAADGVEEIRRKRRSLPDVNHRLILMNELARRVLFSMDAVVQKPKEDGSCHYWSLCENNRYAGKQFNDQKLWIPMWSLGMSWLTTRVWTETPPTGNGYEPLIQSLKAVLVGLAYGSCDKFYENSCDTINY